MDTFAREWTRRLIEDIEVNGHWQDTGGDVEPDRSNGPGPACLVSSNIGPRPHAFKVAVTPAILATGFVPEHTDFLEKFGMMMTGDVTRWNDTTPTEVVLDTLKSLV